MSESQKTSYVLGTNADELERLRHQHTVWRDCTLDLWRRAGIKQGSHVIDVGSGPGFASMDLAEIVGETGRVTALERSENFSHHLRQVIAEKNMKNTTVTQLDLVTDTLPSMNADFAWVRWVSIFLADPNALVAKLRDALRPGGKIIFFEYLNYQTMRMLPDNPLVGEFVERVIASWAKMNGTANVAPILINSLRNHGFTIESARPHLYSPRPQDPFFSWITSFMRVNTARSLELQEISPEWAKTFLSMVQDAEQDPNRLMVTPTILEIIATRP